MQITFFSPHSVPTLYTKMMLSLCATAILVESGEKARAYCEARTVELQARAEIFCIPSTAGCRFFPYRSFIFFKSDHSYSGLAEICCVLRYAFFIVKLYRKKGESLL